MKIGQLKQLPFVERFWAQVDKRGETECWLWKGYVGSRGYGYVKRDYRTLLAHRVSYQMACGSTEGMSVCHRCDTPLCVNPNHLFLGTAQDNADDMVAKGRQGKPKGERHSQAVLTEDDVIEILQSTDSGKSAASRYGVTPSTISNIRSGKTWSHVYRAMARVA